MNLGEKERQGRERGAEEREIGEDTNDGHWRATKAFQVLWSSIKENARRERERDIEKGERREEKGAKCGKEAA